MYNANLDMCTWTFAKTLARNFFLSPFQKKTLPETVNCIPKGLRKGNPFHGPFAQLSYIYIYSDHIYIYIYKHIVIYVQYILIWYYIYCRSTIFASLVQTVHEIAARLGKITNSNMLRNFVDQTHWQFPTRDVLGPLAATRLPAAMPKETSWVGGELPTGTHLRGILKSNN